MSQPNDCYAYFGISGSFDPEDISRQLGVQPTRILREGELIPKTLMPLKTSRWQLKSRLPGTAILEEHMLDVLNQMDRNATGFKAISEQFGGTMELVAEFHAGYPGLVLDRSLVKRLAEYALLVDCDFYWFSETADAEAWRFQA